MTIIDNVREGALHNPLTGEIALNMVETRSHARSWKRLENSDCIKAYAQEFLSTRKDIMLVTKSKPVDAGSLQAIVRYMWDPRMLSGYNPYQWICDYEWLALKGIQSKTLSFNVTVKYNLPIGTAEDLCFPLINHILPIASEWHSNGMQIEYCLSQETEGLCDIQASLPILLVVVLANIGKLFAIYFTAFHLEFEPLVTVGDGVASFLDHPDPTTESMCLAPKDQIMFAWASPTPGLILPQVHKPQHIRRIKSTGTGTCFIAFLLMSLAVVATAALLAYGIDQLHGPQTFSYIWSLGIGAVRPAVLIAGNILGAFNHGSAGLIGAVLLANLPQALLSFLYLYYNNLFTAMCLAHEWNNFSSTRKGLRVSRPKGEQRSKHFLQLPFRYAIPLTILSGLFHWLVSQSLFLASVTIVDERSDTKLFDSVTTLGYSPVAIIFSIVAAIILVTVAVGIGAMRLLPGIPLAGSCSAAISAACHVPRYEGERVAERRLIWGAVHHGEEEGRGCIGHCCFSAKEVEKPVEGRLYA